MRGYVHKKHIITSFEKIEDNSAILETMNGVAFGMRNDAVAYKLQGDPEIIPSEELSDYVQISFSLEDMAQGYMDMADINLEMAKEDLHMENEADKTIQNLFNKNQNVNNKDEDK